jgi:transcriptional regulator with XRE-family HTH domain
MVNSQEFAKRLEEILEYYGVSATAFADAIAVNRSTISHLLSGRNKPSLDFVMKVVRHYPEVSLYWLLNGKGTFPATEKAQPAAGEQGVTEPQTDTTLAQALPQQEDKAIDRIVIFYNDGTFKSYRH